MSTWTLFPCHLYSNAKAKLKQKLKRKQNFWKLLWKLQIVLPHFCSSALWVLKFAYLFDSLFSLVISHTFIKKLCFYCKDLLKVNLASDEECEQPFLKWNLKPSSPGSVSGVEVWFRGQNSYSSVIDLSDKWPLVSKGWLGAPWLKRKFRSHFLFLRMISS